MRWSCANEQAALGRVLFAAEAGEETFVELGDGVTPGPLERTLVAIADLPETTPDRPNGDTSGSA